MAKEEKEAKLVPTDEQGKPIELDGETKLMQLTKKELIEMIESNETKHKKALTRTANLRDENKELKEELETTKDLLGSAEQQQEATNEEAAMMSETIRRKNTIIEEVTDAYLALANTTKTVASQGFKILEMNGLVVNPNPKERR